MNQSTARASSIDVDMSLGNSNVSKNDAADRSSTTIHGSHKRAPATADASVQADDDSEMYISVQPYDQLLEEASKWVRDLEKMKEDMQMLSVTNAFLLDSMAMAGADVELVE